MNLTNKKLEELRKEIFFKNLNPIIDIFNFFENVINLALSLELVEKNLTPKIILGEENKNKDSSKTYEYTQPIISLSLNRRAPQGINDRTLTNTFSNNLISGKTKFNKKIIKKENEEEVEVVEGIVQYDNEIKISLKTKTVKEQMIILPILERALNIYIEVIKPSNIVVCGIINSETEEKKDDVDLETAVIKFQLRTQETVIFDKSYIIRGFEIITGVENDKIIVSSGKIDQNNEWIDNKIDIFGKF